MTWIALIAAGLFETGFALSLKSSEGFTRPVPTLLFALCAVLSFGLLSVALRELPVGVAYAVWTAIGVVGTSIVGMTLHGDGVSLAKMLSLSAILGGVAGLNLASGAAAH